MKFTCEGCNTRYSISDDRVRGKILKIRCKNCADVITVREPEGADVAANQASAPTDDGAALRGAFAQAMQGGSDAGDDAGPSARFAAPNQNERDWYLSLDGKQEGPFSLADAKTWISDQAAEAKLYCWQEDFEDWIPVEKVSHFLRARKASAASKAAAAAPAAAAEVATPTAATGPSLVALQAQQSLQAASNQGISKLEFPDSSDDGAFDFDIGEASRVVKLPDFAGGEMVDLAAPKQGLPGVAKIDDPAVTLGTGTGRMTSLPTDGPRAQRDSGYELQAQPSKSGLFLTMGVGVFAVVITLSIILFLHFGKDDNSEQALANSDLDTTGLSSGMDPTLMRDRKNADSKTTRGRSSSRGSSVYRRRDTSSNTKSETKTGGDGDATTTADASAEARRALSPDEVIAASRRHTIGTKRCYEQALKKDPFLKVKQLKVTITVGTDKRVTGVKLSKYGSHYLGRCLRSRIMSWPFRKASKGITMSLTMKFGN